MTEEENLKEGRTNGPNREDGTGPQKPTYDLENYNIELAVRAVRELGERED
jgi:hypothetical protein